MATPRPPRPTLVNPTATTTTTSNLTTYLRQLHSNSPNSTQLIGILTLLITGAILLTLTGVTLTAFVLTLIFFSPIIILSSPIWLPVGIVQFVAVFGCLSFCGFGVAVAAVVSWVYRYYRGLHPPGSDRVDYARSRIVSTAKEYSGYLQNKVKDVAPGA